MNSARSSARLGRVRFAGADHAVKATIPVGVASDSRHTRFCVAMSDGRHRTSASPSNPPSRLVRLVGAPRKSR